MWIFLCHFQMSEGHYNMTKGDLVPGRFNMTGYPSGYDTWEVILISMVVVFIMASIIIGNLLVIVAIFSEYTLQCVQNWFVASLAVSDLMLGIVVMPFSLSQEVVGYWLFGEFWCQVNHYSERFFITINIFVSRKDVKRPQSAYQKA